MVDKHYSDTQDFFNNVAIEKQGFYENGEKRLLWRFWDKNGRKWKEGWYH